MSNLKEREETFLVDVLSAASWNEEYGTKMLDDFFNYWSEPNKSKTKMKWELERTWDTKRRLKRWFDNNKKWSKNATSKTAGAHQLLEELRTDYVFRQG